MKTILVYDKSWLLEMNYEKTATVKIPGRTSPKTEAHIAFCRQRIISQLLKVLWPKIFVSVPGHCVFTCGGTEHAQIRSFPFEKVSLVEKTTPLVISKSPIFSYSSSPSLLDKVYKLIV